MPPTFHILIKLFIFSVLSLAISTKVLEITQKNLPNVLKFQSDILILYHHPDCKYSINYKLKFTQHFHNFQSDNENVGVVDCSQESNLCVSNNISSYPVLKRIYANLTSDILQADLFLAKVNSEYQQTDQYLASQIATKLKQSPNFIFALFEEQGMPVGEEHKLKNVPYSDRIFYLSEGRVAKTLGGFVKNRPGCWIFQLRSQQSGQLYRFQCGNTYQSSFQLQYQLQKYLNQTSIKKPHKPTQIQLSDQSNYQNQIILGYKQFIYWLKNYNLQLQISTHTKVSMCKFIYLWSQHCDHCNYEADMKTIKRSIEYMYDKNPYKGEEQATMKHLIHSYDIQNNRLIINSKDLTKIAALNTTQVKSSSDSLPLLIPNVLSICFSTENSRDLANNVFMQINKLDKIIVSENIDKFVKTIIESQHGYMFNNVRKQKPSTPDIEL